MDYLRRAVESHVSEEDRLVKRHFVYLNTANMSDFVMTDRGIDAFASKQKETREYVVVLRDDVLRLLDDIHIPSVENENESILRQYVIYLRDTSRLYDGIESMRSECALAMIRAILKKRKLGDSIELSSLLIDYGSPGGKKHFHRAYIWNKATGDTIRLLLCLQPKSKSCPKLFLTGYGADPTKFSKVHDYISSKLGAKVNRRMTGDGKLLGDEKAFSTIDKFERFLELAVVGFAEAAALK